MIELNDISFSYGAGEVLDEFFLSVNRGEITCLLGSSGCGKTTILRLIAGLEVPDKGTVVMNEKVFSENGKNVVPAYKRNVGFIFQDLALWPHFTVYKNIAFGLQVRKVPDVKERVMEMLDHFGITDLANKYPHQLSGGQKQLVAISRSLVLNPQALLMDEPLSNLDVQLKRKILEHIKKLKTSFNITIIYVTHDHREAFAIADKVVVLNKGKIEGSGSVEQIKNSGNSYLKDFLEY